jgi:hypothetical protein
MIQFKKSDIEDKQTTELLKYLHESRFHHINYISLVIEVLFERGISRSDFFKSIKTDDLVNIICFDSKKHQIQYLQLVKEELTDRDYDVSSIPNIENEEHYQNSINGDDSKSFSFPKYGKWTGVGLGLAVIICIKLFVRFGAEKADENNNQKAIESINQREELQNSYQFKPKPVDGNFDATINFYKNLSAEESINYGFADTKAFNKFKSLPINEQVETLIPILENLNEQKANELAIIIMSDTNSFIGRLVMEKIQSYKEMADKYPNVSPEEFSDMLSKDLKSAFIGSKCPKISDKIISQSELIIKKYALKRN